MAPVRPLRLAPLLAAALVVLAAGCGDPLAESDYLGEPLLTLEGSVTGTAPLPPLEAAVIWQRGAPPSTSELELADRAPVEPLPTTGAAGPGADFTIRLYQPPPASAFRKLREGEVAWARGNAGAIPLGITADAGPALPSSGSNAYGLDLGHWIVYLAGDVPAGSLTAWWLGGALPAGYHLLRAEPRTECVPAEELEACVGALVGLGVADDATDAPGTARGYCLAPYRLSPAPAGERLLLELGAFLPPEGAGTCP